MAPTGIEVALLSFLLNVLIGLGVALVVGILLFCILKVMISRFFLRIKKQPDCKILAIIFSFKSSECFRVLGCMILKNIYLSLWLLLFVIPGIVKTFSYFMVPYILAENPNIGANRAMTISKQTMKGTKWDLFVFELSFIGWWLLSILTLGIIDIFYVTPYYLAAEAEFYIRMREKAKNMKICGVNELT